MNRNVVRKTLALGALTGMRSTAGAAVLAFQRGGLLKNVLATLAAGEIVADKTAAVGNRIDPAPLAGRALMGAIVGGVIAHEADDTVTFGALLGAAAAVAAAHLAFHARRRLPLPNVPAGLIEDALVASLASAAVRA
jgi:uncharacterized membrane protein